jgi:hypothetical protein
LASVQHRADALFALPVVPQRVAFAGDPPGWRADVAERGIDVVESVDDADVVVGDDVARLPQTRASVLVDGDPAAADALRTRRSGVTRLLTLPVAGTPVAILDLDARRAAAYGIRNAVVHEQRWRGLRNELAAGLARVGRLPAPGRAISIGAERAPPALVAAASREFDLGERDWLMLVSLGAIVRRNAFLLFPAGDDTPAEAVKFARARGYAAQFDRDERAATLVRAAGGVVAAKAPRYIGRFEVDGYQAALEGAAQGEKLSAFLRRPVNRRRKLEMLESVATWLVQVARETAAPPDALASERGRLEQEVLTFWAGRGVDQSLVASLPPVPATFQHSDVAEENIIVSGEEFLVLDWEFAQPRGLPLADLLYFGVHVLRIVDGARTEEERDRHFVDVVTGRAPSSPILFRWIRNLVGALELPAEAVGKLTTLNWLDRGKLSQEEHRRAETLGGVELADSFAERASRTWLEHPQLGPGWSVWRS